MKIKLRDIDDAVMFVSICNKYPFDIDYKYCNNHYILDAKSIVSVLGAGINKEAEVDGLSDDKEVLDKFFEEIGLWKVGTESSIT